MNISTKLLKAAAGSAGGAGLDVDEVFSTFLYDGTGSNLEINNGIDLSSEGGLIWVKRRNGSDGHWLVDTERGLNKSLQSHSTNADNTGSDQIVSFDSDGFTLGNRNEGQNYSGLPYVSWTFRKAPKFFDVVTYTGSGENGQTITHDLGVAPGMVIVKDTSSSGKWYVYHRSLNSGEHLKLNATDGVSTDSNYEIGKTTASSTEFSIDTGSEIDYSGNTYVAYLFAHNNGDGGFGPDSDQDIIKCGSYTGNGSSTGPTVNLGFEPQFLMVKRTDDSGRNWNVYDSMRGFFGTNSREINWNLSNAEQYRGMLPTSTGFQPKATSFQINASGGNYIYMAIRRGPLAAPTDATKVFAIDTMGSTGDGNAPSFRSTFPVDMAMRVDTSGANKEIAARLMGSKWLYTNTTDAGANLNQNKFDYQNGWMTFTSTASNYYSYMWKRAPSYFDMVAYSGTGSARTVSHNLGAAPEMIWVKARSHIVNWVVYHKDLSAGQYLMLNKTNAVDTNSAYFTTTAPTSSVFSIGVGEYTNQSSSHTYVAYLFGTVAGVSKVGSFNYTSGSAQNIDCGFSSGARFVLYKRYSGTSAWTLFDTTRGIVAGNDPMLMLNTTSAEDSSYDFIDPYSSGFALSDSTANLSGDYIFYAIA